MSDYFVNKSNNNYFVHKGDIETKIHYWKRTYKNWTQPVLTGSGNVQQTSIGRVEVYANASSVRWIGSNQYTMYPWGALYKSPEVSPSGIKQWVGGTSAVGWWQVKLPANIIVKGLRVYGCIYWNQQGTVTYRPIISGRFYTSSNKQTPIGNSFASPQQSTAAPFTYVDVAGIPDEGIETDFIYLAKTGAANSGMMHLQITAIQEDKPIESDSSDYDYTTIENVQTYWINKN